MKNISIRILAASFLVLSATLSPAAQAHGESEHMDKAIAEISPEEHAFGRQGDPRKVTRTIAIALSDNMRFGPDDITVKAGETIRFVVTNKGKMLHEMVIGTMDEIKAHAEMMKKYPGMEHDEPYMAHVPPSNRRELIWQFTKGGEFYFACLIPGHFEAGMFGKIKAM